MKSNFVKSSNECSTFAEMIGKTIEEFNAMQENFKQAVEEKKITNSAQVAEWCLENTDTVEEAVILTAVCIKAVERAKHESSMSTMMEVLGMFGSLGELTGETEEVEEEIAEKAAVEKDNEK